MTIPHGQQVAHRRSRSRALFGRAPTGRRPLRVSERLHHSTLMLSPGRHIDYAVSIQAGAHDTETLITTAMTMSVTGLAFVSTDLDGITANTA